MKGEGEKDEFKEFSFISKEYQSIIEDLQRKRNEKKEMEEKGNRAFPEQREIDEKILERMIEYFSIRDLLAMSRVNKFWRNIILHSKSLKFNLQEIPISSDKFKKNENQFKNWLLPLRNQIKYLGIHQSMMQSDWIEFISVLMFNHQSSLHHLSLHHCIHLNCFFFQNVYLFFLQSLQSSSSSPLPSPSSNNEPVVPSLVKPLQRSNSGITNKDLLTPSAAIPPIEYNSFHLFPCTFSTLCKLFGGVSVQFKSIYYLDISDCISFNDDSLSFLSLFPNLTTLLLTNLHLVTGLSLLSPFFPFSPLPFPPLFPFLSPSSLFFPFSFLSPSSLSFPFPFLFFLSFPFLSSTLLYLYRLLFSSLSLPLSFIHVVASLSFSHSGTLSLHPHLLSHTCTLHAPFLHYSSFSFNTHSCISSPLLSSHPPPSLPPPPFPWEVLPITN